MDSIRCNPSVVTRLILIVCFIFFYNLLAGQSFGQNLLNKNNPPAKPDSKLTSFIRGGYLYQFDTDIGNSNGSFTADRFFIQPGIRYSPNYTTSYSFSIGYGYDGYNFKGVKGFSALRPWSDIHSFRLGALARFTQGPNWSFFIGPTLRATGERGANIDDSITGGGFAGFTYRFNERLSIGPGVGFIYQIEDDASLFPIIAINWKISDTLTLETGRGLGATLGPGISLNWQISEQWKFTLAGRYEKLRFRLDDKSETPSGIGQDTSLPILGGVTYKFNSSTSLSLIGGFKTIGELKLEDQNGNVLKKHDYESSAFLGFSFYFRN
jgi:hypothetical protein